MCKKAEAGQGQIEKASQLLKELGSPRQPPPAVPQPGLSGGRGVGAAGTDWHCDSSATSQALLFLYSVTLYLGR